MGARERRRERAVRRICESVVASVAGGLILWSVTRSTSQSTPAPERIDVASGSVVEFPATSNERDFARTSMSNGPSFAPLMASEDPAAQMVANTPLLASIPGPVAAAPGPSAAVAMPAPAVISPPDSIPVGSILLYEDFSRFRAGDATDWGPNTLVTTGLDRRNWLVSNIDGTHLVGRKIRLPNEFYFECRYSANMPELTRGLFGWWREPVTTKISFLNDQGVKYTIEWVVSCGNDTTRLNPLGSSSLYAKKYFHTIKLPDGTTSEVGAVQPTGMFRIDRANNVVKVFVDGQSAVVGTASQLGQLIGFEIDVVKAKNGGLFFTDFKIAR